MASVNRDGVARSIARMGIRPTRNEGRRYWYSVPDLLRATLDPKHFAEERRAQARAEQAELDLRERKGELFDRDKIRETHLRVVAIIGKRVSALPRSWSHRANPTNPEVAKEALELAARHIMQPLEDDESGE